MITLLSDFGLQDAYVAAMKGTIALIAPRIPMCDITHLIPPQDILAARFNLMVACPYFPLGTVHLAVVDPGVGSKRRAIALQTSRAFFVGPDNGLFSGILEQTEVLNAVSLTNEKYWRTAHPSVTFHGRDIFAPVAAHLAKGVPIEELGDTISPKSIVKARIAPCKTSAEYGPQKLSAVCTGSVQHIDHFGNIITNIPARFIPSKSKTTAWELRLKTATRTHQFPGVRTYSDVPVGTLAALVGSHGWVEVACNSGSAQSALQASNQTAPVMVGNTVSLCVVSL